MSNKHQVWILAMTLPLLIGGCKDSSSSNSGGTANSSVSLVEVFPQITFIQPLDIQDSGDGTNRLFIVERRGVIHVLVNSISTTATSLFLDIQSKVESGSGEQGLLGLAFHPNYKSNGYFYVCYVAAGPTRSVIARYKVSGTDADQADSSSELVLLEFNQPDTNHNGGQLAFGADGYLYIASGDGGGSGDPSNNGQSLSTLLGKILRIDVDNPAGGKNYGIPSDNPFVGVSGAKEEIYAYGLRNPWRMSFDHDTGQLWVGDVGQGRREEIDIIERGKNYGWKQMEGNVAFVGGADAGKYTAPVFDYDHSVGRSITGGYVYRGSSAPSLVGKYIYADFITKKLFALTLDNGSTSSETLMDMDIQVSSFGVDSSGELYLCDYGNGKIYQVSE